MERFNRALLCSVIAVASVVAPRSATATTANIFLCQGKEGPIRQVATASCTRKETLVVLAVPPGAQGPAGPAGSDGATGEAGAGAFQVFDALGNLIGPYMPGSAPGVEIVLLHDQGNLIQARFTPGALYPMLEGFYFLTTDCTGAPYIYRGPLNEMFGVLVALRDDMNGNSWSSFHYTVPNSFETLEMKSLNYFDLGTLSQLCKSTAQTGSWAALIPIDLSNVQYPLTVH